MSQKSPAGKRALPEREKKRLWLPPVLILLILALCAAAYGIVHGFDRSEPQPEEAPVTTAEAQETAAPAETAAPVTETPIPETETPEPTEAPSLAETLLSGMSLREKVCQLFIVTPEQITGTDTVTAVDDSAAQSLAETPVGGVIFFAQNLETRTQTNDMIAALQSCSPLGLFISVDEEGGKVARLGSNPEMGTTAFPNMASIGSTGDPEQARAVGRTIGSELWDLGFNLDFAPVADVNSNPDNPVIGTRSFSSDPQTCAEMVSACVEGFLETGTLCTLKHFPGHGDTAEDTHEGAAVLNKTMEELEQTELIPFAAGIDAGAELVMVSHISLPEITGDNTPATLSPQIISILREDLGFDGLIITDSLSMGAITDFYSSGDAAVLALQAGADLLLMPQSLSEAVDGVISAVADGTISEARIDESVLRILQMKLDHCIISAE